ncbi:MAG: YggT family protein [Proteobacteria bacterium]|nr:YggT family protein [Pseudomonadota bacterium]HQR03809.1 YggT family protein [Rhodocyclaceae bacterium]
MLIQLFALILETICGFFCLAFLARFALQWARAPFRNPVGQFLIAVTDWAARPARRVIPSAWGHDLPSLVLAWMSQGIHLGLMYGLQGLVSEGAAIPVIALLAVLETLKAACHLALGIVVVNAILSWVNPFAPLAPLFSALSRPLLAPFQRFIPPIGGVDLSPIAFLVAIQAFQIVLSACRQSLIAHLLT